MNKRSLLYLLFPPLNSDLLVWLNPWQSVITPKPLTHILAWRHTLPETTGDPACTLRASYALRSHPHEPAWVGPRLHIWFLRQ